ncbi:MAG: hypothetical protein GYA17_15440 [Chloroflexi bacterium]|nr:hypothetical protein [Chloroflexota bacterium]
MTDRPELEQNGGHEPPKEYEAQTQVGGIHVRVHITAPQGTRLRVSIQSLDPLPPGSPPVDLFVIADPVDGALGGSLDQDETPEEISVGLSPVVEMTAAPAGRQPAAGAGEPALEAPDGAAELDGSLLAGGLAWLRERLPGLWRRGLAALSGVRTLEGALLATSLAAYALTRLIGLADFPIYFFTDEAVQTVLASDLLRDGWHGGDGLLLPTYFLNTYQYNLSTSVYLQVLPLVLFGRSVFVTRGICVLVSLLAAVWVGLTLKKVFHSPYAWLAVLVLSITPAWFLHSRTAFETSLATTFFAGFIYFYLRYRTEAPRYLTGAVVCGTLMFYSYAAARMVIGLLAVMLLLVDLPYHWRHRSLVLKHFVAVLLLALPLLRFQLAHPEENMRHLEILNSYWIQDISVLQKVERYLEELLKGLSPAYWYLPNQADLARHVMQGYGHLLVYSLPFGLGGLLLALYRVRQPAYRTLLLALLAAPSGAALVGLGITRALAMVIPAALITALALSFLLEKIRDRWPGRQVWLNLGVGALLVGFNFWMLYDALENGPLWSDDYTLTGMQYGARQLFGTVGDYVREHPGVDLTVSTTWANGTDTVARFFYYDYMPFRLGNIEGYLNEHLPLSAHKMFVMTPEEFKMTLESGKFKPPYIDKILPYPDGRPGFYFVQVQYVDNIDQVLAAESAERNALQVGSIDLYDTSVPVRYSRLDMGEITNLFDGDIFSMVRTAGANPLRVQLDLPRPEKVKAVELKIGGAPTDLLVEALGQDGLLLASQSGKYKSAPNPHTVRLEFPQAVEASYFNLVIHNTEDQEPAHVHIWEITFLEK